MKKSRVRGLNTVFHNLNKEVRKIKGRTQAGMTAAALLVRGEAQKLTPVVTGNLRNSAFVVGGGKTTGGSPRFDGTTEEVEAMAANHADVIEGARKTAKRREPAAAAGFSAWYTTAVHENPRAGKTGGSRLDESEMPGILPSGRRSTRIVYSVVGQWKFLEDAVKNNKKRILAAIKRRARIK